MRHHNGRAYMLGGLLLTDDAVSGRSIATATAAAAVATAPAATTPAAAAVTTAATGAGLARLGLIDGQATTVVLLLVEATDGRIGFGIAAHLHEAEALAPARLSVGDD